MGLYAAFRQKAINARAENAAEKVTFAPLLRAGRCLIAARAYYEWDQGKQQYRFFVPEKPLYMAGLYRMEAADEAHFVVLTRAAQGAAVTIHDRMPVILPDGECCALWLQSDELAKELLSLPLLCETIAEKYP